MQQEHEQVFLPWLAEDVRGMFTLGLPLIVFSETTTAPITIQYPPRSTTDGVLFGRQRYSGSESSTVHS